MMNNSNYFANIDAEYVRSLPVLNFSGIINLIDEPTDIEIVRNSLQSEKILGFDTETKPTFKKGKINSVSMLQLSSGDQAFLFRLNMIRLPEFIIEIFENKEIIKVGVAIKDDINALNKLVPFIPEGFIDLQHFVKQFGIEDNGLKKLVANILGFRISKKSQTSNWEQQILTNEQLYYAATDAWVCREIYKNLNSRE